MVYADRTPTPDELNVLYGSYPEKNTLSPVTRLRFLELLRRMEAYRHTGRLLDVGSGSGFFLDVALERGWSAHGTEHGSAMVEACRSRGIHMQQGPLDPIHYEPASFDVITSFEVIEHLVDPMADLRKMVSLLRPGGMLYITTPNFNAWSRTLAGPEWSIVNWPEHLNYFTPRTLTAMVHAQGLRKLRVSTTGISVTRVRAGRTSVKQENVDPNNDDERLRKLIERRWYLRAAKSAVNVVLDLFGKGDALKATFVKPG